MTSSISATIAAGRCWCLAMRIVTPALLALGLAGAVAVPARADTVVTGHGWGHGVGLSQYGAYGYALLDGRDHAWILAHYYTGTSLARIGHGRVRVLLRRTRRPALCDVTRLRDARGRRVRLSARRVYRFTARGSRRLDVRDLTRGRHRASVVAPVSVSGGSSWCLRGRADNGVSGGAYRGSAQLVRSGRRILVVDRVGLERYLYGVVPSEMPASWPAQALEAQADVARSYALRSLAPGQPFDLYADTRSQMYTGLAGESAATTAAVRATAGEVVTYAGQIAQTFFFSSSGGRTASNEEVWGGAPIPYLRSIADPHDDLSPYHDWQVTFTDRQLRQRLASVAPGRLQAVRVASRTASGRAATVSVRGRNGTATVPASEIESLLGLRSTWFSFRHTR